MDTGSGRVRCVNLPLTLSLLAVGDNVHLGMTRLRHSLTISHENLLEHSADHIFILYLHTSPHITG